MLAPLLYGMLLILSGMVLGALLCHSYMTSVETNSKVRSMVQELDNLLKHESSMLDCNRTTQKLMDFTKNVLPKLKGLL